MLEVGGWGAGGSLGHAGRYADLGGLNAELTQEKEALRASKERWRKLFENSSAGIALVTPAGRYIAANLALQKILGYTEEELQRLTALYVTHDEHRSPTEPILP